MQLHGSDPDIQTLVQRIDSCEIDLQPDFQRGEVWPIAKRQRLVDSILREWHVPPIHLVEEADTKQQLVLDGQQRLASIRDFAHDVFPLNGLIEPISSELRALHGYRFSELPELWKRRFLRFTIRQFRITNYEPSEPGELFYRLNQPSALTSAEVRNAFFGITRQQVKSIIDEFQKNNLDETFWGFSNARMALDDVVARSLYLLDEKSLLKKTGSASLADKYRKGTPFSNESETLIRQAGQLLKSSIDFSHGFRPFNKATAQSWLIFTATAIKYFGPKNIHDRIPVFLEQFESTRGYVPLFGVQDGLFKSLEHHIGSKGTEILFLAYDDRAKSRVSDTSSVAIRDFALWITFRSENQHLTSLTNNHRPIELVDHILASKTNISNIRDVEELVSRIEWGASI